MKKRRTAPFEMTGGRGMRRSASGERGMLRRYGRETHYADIECIGHWRELCVV
jgi:hypothetical protein